MCGSTNNARSLAFVTAAAFFADQGTKQIGAEAPKGPTRKSIEYLQSLGAGEAPATVVALADAEDKVLGLVREAQQAQQEIVLALIGNSGAGAVFADSSSTETLVATLNNLKVAIAERDTANDAVNAEARDVLGASDASPVLQ